MMSWNLIKDDNRNGLYLNDDGLLDIKKVEMSDKR